MSIFSFGHPSENDTGGSGGSDTGGTVPTPDTGGGTPPDVPGQPTADVVVSHDTGTTPEDSGDSDCGYGDVIGVVCSPSGTIYINDALVFVETVDCDGRPLRVETTSDANGEYTLTGVPSGLQTIEVRKDSFQHTVEVPVQAGRVNDLRGTQAKLCFGATAARIAVIGGTYDSIQEILDGLGIDYDLFRDDPPLFFGTSEAVEFLMDDDALTDYHILFVNCSEWAWDNLYVYGDSNIIALGLGTFVQNGGSLYASDWAAPFIERPWPGAIDFYGDDTDHWAAKMGVSGSYTAQVQDPSLAAYLGKDEVRINFDLEHWVVMEGAAPSALTHIDAVVPEAGGRVPLMASIAPYPLGGRVLFTSFHNEAQITDDMANILNFLVFSL